MEIKSGAKTSEFYITLIPMVLLAIKQIAGIELEQDIIVNGILGAVSAVTAITYTISRVKIKTEQMKLTKKGK